MCATGRSPARCRKKCRARCRPRGIPGPHPDPFEECGGEERFLPIGKRGAQVHRLLCRKQGRNEKVLFFPEDFRERAGSHPFILKRVGEGKPGCQPGKGAFHKPPDEDHRELHVRAFEKADDRDTIGVLKAALIPLIGNDRNKPGKFLCIDGCTGGDPGSTGKGFQPGTELPVCLDLPRLCRFIGSIEEVRDIP